MSNTCSLECNIATAWVDAPITVVVMNYGENRQDQSLAINLRGQVPVLALDDG